MVVTNNLRFKTSPRWPIRDLLRLWPWVLPFMLLFLLGTRGLNEPDEGRYAEIAREMIEDGDWLVPHLNGFAHMQKPPLIYWFTAASFRCFGLNEWAARLPSALAAMGSVWMTFFITRRLWGHHRAHVAAIMLMSSLGLFALGRLLTPDMVMCFWILASIAALVHGRAWLFFIAMGLGFLTKGPMALVVPLSAALGWRLAGGLRPGWPWFRGLLLTLGLGLSWFVVVCLRDPQLLHYYLHDELLKRVASHSHGRKQPWWFFIPVLLVALMPWTFCSPRVIRQAWRRLRTGTWLARHGLLAGWVLPPLLVLSMSGSKLPTYALPLLPALVILFCPPLVDVYRLWKIGSTAVALWITVLLASTLMNDLLGRQASVRDLALNLEQRLEAKPGEVFLCGTRAHGIEFYLRQRVGITLGEADMMLPPSTPASALLHDHPQDCLHDYADKQAYGLMLDDCFKKHFAPAGWVASERVGDYVLAVHERPVMTASAKSPPTR